MIEYPVEPLRRALSWAGIAAPPSDEELANRWAEYAQMVIRYVERQAYLDRQRFDRSTLKRAPRT